MPRNTPPSRAKQNYPVDGCNADQITLKQADQTSCDSPLDELPPVTDTHRTMQDAGDTGRASPFELRALDYGVYLWGSLLPTFRPLSPTSASAFGPNLAGLIGRVGTWKTPKEFRGWVSLSHELTHYLQDLTTGVGHWDHSVRTRTRSGLFSQALRLTGPEVQFPMEVLAASNTYPYPPLSETLAKALALNQELREELLVVTGDTAPPARETALEERAAPLLTESSLARTYRIESLLEGEAAAVVIRQVLRTEEATEDQWEILRDNAEVWHPDQMLAEYGELWFDLVATVQTAFGVDFASMQDRDRYAFYELTGTLLGLLVDLACAHPSPQLLEETRADRREYEPGLRYVRMLAVLARMSPKEFEAWVSAFTEPDFERVEALLVEACGYRYIPSRVVYEDWLAHLETGDELRWMELLRADACRIRLERPGAWIEKSPFTMVEEKVPLLIIGPEGISSIAQRWEHFERDAKSAIYRDLTQHAIMLNLSDYFYESGRYVCPLGLARTCEVATDDCRSGLRYTSKFPEHPDCRVREWLQSLGFYLGGGNGERHTDPRCTGRGGEAGNQRVAR